MKPNAYRFGIFFVVGMLVLSACNAAPSTTPRPTATQNRSTGQTRTSGGNTAASTQPSRVRATTAAPAATATPVLATATAALPSATVTPYTQPTPTIGAEGKLVIPVKRQTIQFSGASTSSAVALTLSDQTPQAYQFDASAGQTLYLSVAGTANIQVFSPSQVPLTPVVVMPGMIQLALPESGAYVIVMQGLRKVTLNVYLVSASQNPASGALLPEQPQVVKIPLRPYSVTLDTRLDPSAPAGYSFQAQAGQRLILTLTGDVVPAVIAPDGNTLVPNPDLFSGQWSFALVETGEYKLALAGNGVAAVRVEMTAPGTVSLPAVQPGSGTRLVMPEGDTAIDLSTNFAAGKPQTFVLNAPAKHQMIVTVTGNAGVVQVTGPDQKPVNMVHSQLVPTWSFTLDQAGDYTIVVDGSGPSVITFSIPAAGIVLP